MIEHTTPNGNLLKVGASTWKYSNELKRAVFKELKKNGLDVESMVGKKGIASFVKDTDIEDVINPLVDHFLALDSSELVYKAFINCAKKSLYDGEVITDGLFEISDNARQDYYFIMFHVVKGALSPLLKSLFAAFGAVAPTAKDSPQ